MFWHFDAPAPRPPQYRIQHLYNFAPTGATFALTARLFAHGTDRIPTHDGTQVICHSSLWPYVAFFREGERPIVVERTALEQFLELCDVYPVQRARIQALISAGAGYIPVVDDQPTGNRVVEVIDTGFLADITTEAHLDRLVLRRDVGLLFEDGEITSGQYGVFPAATDRLLGTLATGQRFVTRRSILIAYMEEIGQDVPDDLRAVPDEDQPF